MTWLGRSKAAKSTEKKGAQNRIAEAEIVPSGESLWGGSAHFVFNLTNTED